MAVSARIQEIYLALFGRPADPVGGEFYDSLTNDGANLDPILTGASRLSGSSEYLDRFTGETNVEIVNTIFQSLFGHPADLAGLTFYVQTLANGDAAAHGMPLPFPGVPAYTIEQIAVGILDGATGSDAAIVDAKVAAAELFTDSLDTPAEIAAYTGADAASLARDFISGVTGPVTQGDIDAAIQNIIDNGQAGISINLTSSIDVVNLGAPAPLTATDHNDVIYGVITGNASATLNTGDNLNGAGGIDTLDVIATSNTSTLVTLNSVEKVRVQAVGSGATLDATNWNGVQQVALHDSANNDLTLNHLTGPVDFAFLNDDAGPGTTSINANFNGGVLGTDAMLNVMVNNSTNAELNVDTNGGDAITGLHVTAVGSDNFFDFTGNGADATHLVNVVVDGTGEIEIDADDFGALKSFDASGNSGGVTVDLSSTDQDLTAKGGSGNDSFEVDFDHKVTATLGDGNDRLTIDGLGPNGNISLDGGAGTEDVLGFADATDADAASHTAGFAATFTGFEEIAVGQVQGNTEVHVDLAGLNNINYVESDGTSVQAISEVQETDFNGADSSGGSIFVTVHGHTPLKVDLNPGDNNIVVAQKVAAAISAANYSDVVSATTNGDDNVIVTYASSLGNLSQPQLTFTNNPDDFTATYNAVGSTNGVTGAKEVFTVHVDAGTGPVVANATYTLTHFTNADAAKTFTFSDLQTADTIGQAVADQTNNDANSAYTATYNSTSDTITFTAKNFGVMTDVTESADPNNSFAAPANTTQGAASTKEVEVFNLGVNNNSQPGRIVFGGVVINLASGATVNDIGAAILNHTADILAADTRIESLSYNSAGSALTVTFKAGTGNINNGTQFGPGSGTAAIQFIGDNNPNVGSGGSFTDTNGNTGSVLNIDNAATGGTLHLTGDNDGMININLATDGTSDTYNVILDNNIGHSDGFIGVHGIESLTVTQNDTTVGGGDHDFALNDSSALKTFTVTGPGGLQFHDTDLSGITLFDASGVTGTGADGSVSAGGIGSGHANVTVNGGAGDDNLSANSDPTHVATLNGNGGNDHLEAGDGADVLNGGEGNDTLAGHAGLDTLTGGAGNDTFLYYAVTDSQGVTVDNITDFTSGSDTIDIHAITGGTGTYEGEATGYGAVLTSLAAGQVRAVLDSTTGILYVDVNHDGALDNNDLAIHLVGVTDLTNSGSHNDITF